MTLGELITALEAADPAQTVRHGLTHPHSYRGDYMDLAFEPAADVTVADMLADARSALGTTYAGWKGGGFTMREHTWCWLSREGEASEETISALLLKLMLAAPAAVPSVSRAAELQRMADEEQPTGREVRPRVRRWRVEEHDGSDWIPRFGPTGDRQKAVERLAARRAEIMARWAGEAVYIQLVRETTTWTAEAPSCAAGGAQ